MTSVSSSKIVNMSHIFSFIQRRYLKSVKYVMFLPDKDSEKGYPEPLFSAHEK